MPTSTTVKGLNINELTEAQYDAAVQGGVIGPNELSVLTDVSYVEPSDLATVATTGDYDDLINKPTIPAALPDQTGHSGEFLTTDGTDASWAAVNALQNMATGTESLSVGKATTANYVVTVVNSDAATATTAQGSAVVGSGAFSQARDGVALGRLASIYSNNGEYGIAIGGNSSTRGRSGINIGYGAGSNGGNGDYGIAIGREANAKQNYSIQLGRGDNNEAGTFYVASYYNSANVNYKLMDADGTIPTARFTTDPVSDGTYVPTLTISSGVATRSWSAPSGGLPSQTGNAGKFLTTDGTDASWSDKPLVNTATGTNSISTGTGTSVTHTYCTIVGSNASTTGNYGTAFGNSSKVANCGVSLGSNVNSAVTPGSFSTAVGYTAKTTQAYSISFGCAAEATAVGAIQIGYGTNNEVGTLCVGVVKSASPWDQTNYKLLDSDGTIPEARLADTTNAAQGQVLTLDNSGNAVWQTPSTAVTSTTATLVVADWVANTQTLTVSGVTSSNVVIVSPQPLSSGDYATAGVLCTAQNTNSLTFTCTQTPSNAIDLSIVIIG